MRRTLNQSRIEYIQLLLGDSREELARADSKVNILLGTAGVAVSIIAGDIAAEVVQLIVARLAG